MGCIDKLTATIVCEKCGASEEVSAIDYGSNWNGSNWQGLGKFESFNVEWTGGGQQEPEITKATCKCGGNGEVSYAYKP
jgi:hypothetical protein